MYDPNAIVLGIRNSTNCKFVNLAKRWHSFGKMVAQNWQKNDNDLAEHLCYNPNMRNWDFRRSPSFLI